MGYLHDEEQVRLLRAILQVGNRIFKELAHLEEVASFAIEQHGDSDMAIEGIIPGNSGVFTAAPLAANGEPTTLPSGTVPVWKTSDTVNAPISVSADGLTATVAVPASEAAAGSFTLEVSAAITDAQGNVTNPSGSATVNYLAAPVASFGIAQTS